MPGTEDAQVSKVRQVFGGELTPTEVDFLRGIQELFRAAPAQKGGFNRAIGTVAARLREVIRRDLDLGVRSNIDASVFQREIGESVLSLPKEERPATTQEEEFCRDVVAAVDFVIRNGIGLGLMVNVLSHDIGEILHHGSLDEACSLGFSPKVAGWAQYDQEVSIGDPDEVEE